MQSRVGQRKRFEHACGFGRYGAIRRTHVSDRRKLDAPRGCGKCYAHHPCQSIDGGDVMSDLTHFNAKGEAHMVDVSDKAHTDRIATARGHVKMQQETFDMIAEGRAKKGDVLSVARLAGIMGAKKTPDLIPLCHPLAITKVTVDLTLNPDLPGVDIEASVKTTGQTGVEMEALTAASVAGLTVYDMIKAVDKTMEIGAIRVVLKDGGKSGRYTAE